jgi:hypothetical protein
MTKSRHFCSGWRFSSGSALPINLQTLPDITSDTDTDTARERPR